MAKKLTITRYVPRSGRYFYELTGEGIHLKGHFEIQTGLAPNSQEELEAIRDKLKDDAGHADEAIANLEVIDDA